MYIIRKPIINMRSSEWDKVAKEYHEEIASPFQEDVINPIFKHLDKLSSKRKSVIDLGCGTGPLLPFLSKRFGNVVGIDFSKKMIDISKKVVNNFKLKNVKILKKDIRNLKGFENKFDVSVCVNSVLIPNLSDVDKSLSNFFSILKSKGTFLGVFPAIESDIYRAMLTYERELKRTKSKKKSEKNMKSIIVPKDYNFLLGYYYNKGYQKHFYRFEIMYRLKKAGFKQINIGKVLYPWKYCVDDDIEYFKDKENLWDWFVSAKK